MGKIDVGNIVKNPWGIFVVTALTLIILTVINGFIPIKLGFLAQVSFMFLSAMTGYTIYQSVSKGQDFSDIILPIIVVIILVLLSLFVPTLFPSAFVVVQP